MAKQTRLLTQPFHLVARFRWSLSAQPPTADEEAWARSHLLPGEIELWERMSDMDRAHSAIVARRFVTARPSATRAEVAGALLHDVGKIDSQLGPWSRAAASVVGGRTRRFRSYLDHERIGAELAAAAGSDPATVDLIAERGPAFATLHRVDHA